LKDNSQSFYESYVHREGGSDTEDRILQIVSLLPNDAQSLLDVGCSEGRNLRVFQRKLPNARLCGTDIGESMGPALRAEGFDFVAADANESLPFEDASFDVIVCGEVIEHIVDPDSMLKDFYRILKPQGLLVITTPNLAYLPNRLLLLAGIQPLFTETSLLRNYGRRLKALGQGNAAQGHLRIFTLSALLEMLTDHKFRIKSKSGYAWLQVGIAGIIDRFFARQPTFAAGFIVAASRMAD